MTSFAEICRQLFLLARTADLPRGRDRGAAWERLVFDLLANRMVPVESAPGGFDVCGRSSLSGLTHQLDAVFGSRDAIVIAEWKAYQGAIPKNEVLRFKAASDDYLLGLARCMPRWPVVRVFGGPGRAGIELRRYAALHGIVMLDSWLWPAPVLANEAFGWPGALAGPADADRRLLAWGGRPWQSVMKPLRDGFLVEITPAAARVDSFLRMHQHWSDELWKALSRRRESGSLSFERRRTGADGQGDGLSL
jgi:hypothetical protein